MTNPRGPTAYEARQMLHDEQELALAKPAEIAAIMNIGLAVEAARKVGVDCGALDDGLADTIHDYVSSFDLSEQAAADFAARLHGYADDAARRKAGNV